MTTKTASVRLDKTLYDRIDEYCSSEDSSRNDFIRSAIESALNNNKQDDDVEHKPHYDSHGNYWYWNDDRKIWTCRVNLNNAKVVP